MINGLILEGKELKEGVEEIFKRDRREERGGNSASEAREYGTQKGSYEEKKALYDRSKLIEGDLK